MPSRYEMIKKRQADKMAKKEKPKRGRPKKNNKE